VALWVPFMEHKDVFYILDALLDRTDKITARGALALLESVLASLLASRDELGVINGLQARLSELLTLDSSLHIAQYTVAEVIAISLPLFHDNRPCSPNVRLQPLVKEAEIHWDHRLDHLPEELDIDIYLSQPLWSDVTVKIVSTLLYRSPAARAKFSVWIESDQASQQSISKLVFALYAFLDSSPANIPLTSVSAAYSALFDRLVGYFFDDSINGASKAICGQCISLITRLTSERSTLLKTLEVKLRSLTADAISTELLFLGRRLYTDLTTDSVHVTAAIVDLGLHWAVRCFSLDMPKKGEARSLLKNLGKRFRQKIMANLTRSFCSDSCFKNWKCQSTLGGTGAIVGHQGSFTRRRSYKVLRCVIKACKIKGELEFILASRFLIPKLLYQPATVNRNIQNIVQHVRFFTTCANVQTPSSPKEAVVRLLYTLFHLHPVNTCQPSHIEPLRQVYGGTLSESDQKILSIFRLFETQRTTSCASILCRWSSSGEFISDDSLAALQSLDSSQVFTTSLQFPNWRRCDESTVDENDGGFDAKLYDPFFIILLFAHMIVKNPPTFALAWVELFRTNVVCVIVRALSSKDKNIRDLALSQITALWRCLEVRVSCSKEF
jgi:nucleolar pre-ribosomal-associated protein 1